MSKGTKLAVCGSGHWTDANLIDETMARFCNKRLIAEICTAGRGLGYIPLEQAYPELAQEDGKPSCITVLAGADFLAEAWAVRSYGGSVSHCISKSCPRTQALSKTRATAARHTKLSKHCDLCIAFWDGHSMGTLGVMQAFQSQHKVVWVCSPDGAVAKWDGALPAAIAAHRTGGSRKKTATGEAWYSH